MSYRVLAVSLAFVSAAAGQSQAPRTSTEARNAAAGAARQQQTNLACEKSAQEKFRATVTVERKALAEVNKLVVQKKKVLEELKGGFYCNRCWRTASEIEKSTRQAFQKHLQDVKGVAVPAPASKVRDRMQQFDRDIARARRDVEAVNQRQRDSEMERMKCSADRARQFILQQQMLVVAAQLEAQERAERERQRLAEFQQAEQERQLEWERQRELQRLQIEAQDRRQRLEAEQRYWAYLQARQAPAPAPREQPAAEYDFNPPESEWDRIQQDAARKLEEGRRKVQEYRDAAERLRETWNVSTSTGPRGWVHRIITRDAMDREKSVLKDFPNVERALWEFIGMGDGIVDAADSFDPSAGVRNNFRRDYAPEFDPRGALDGNPIDFKLPGRLWNGAQRYVNTLIQELRGELKKFDDAGRAQP